MSLEAFLLRMRMQADHLLAETVPPAVARRWCQGRLAGEELQLRIVQVLLVPRWNDSEAQKRAKPKGWRAIKRRHRA